MDLDDLFSKKHPKHGKRGYGYLKNATSYSHRTASYSPLSLFSLLLKSKLLWGLLLFAVLLLGLAGAFIVMALIPLLAGSLEFIGQNGLKGVVESAIPYAEKLWHGNQTP